MEILSLNRLRSFGCFFTLKKLNGTTLYNTGQTLYTEINRGRGIYTKSDNKYLLKTSLKNFKLSGDIPDKLSEKLKSLNKYQQIHHHNTKVLSSSSVLHFNSDKSSLENLSSSIPIFNCDKSAITNLFQIHSSACHERAFFINDLGFVERQYKRWNSELPTVRPFYAVKCNPDEVLLAELHSLGAGFDVASGEEMCKVIELGASPSAIIFANPIKNSSDLKLAAKLGVKKMTFDNVDELYKIKQFCPNAELVMRLLPDDSGSLMRFGVKFGTPQQHIIPLLETCKRLNLNIIGTSFHIGSGCFDAQKYRSAIKLCREVFDIAEQKLNMPKFTFLDLGGGFPGNPIQSPPTTYVIENGAKAIKELPSFEDMTKVIRDSLNDYFPSTDYAHVQVIAEPGRYMATSFSTLFTYIQGKREEPGLIDLQVASTDGSDYVDVNDGPLKKFLYYINDGVYGSFNCIMFDHAHPIPIPMYRFMSNKVAIEDKDYQGYPTVGNMRRRVSAPRSDFADCHLHGQNIGFEPRPQYAYARSIMSRSQRPKNSLATFFGPTCDSMDVIGKNVLMEELFTGEWVGFENMGAYTNAAASTFNGMQKARIIYCRSNQEAPLKH